MAIFQMKLSGVAFAAIESGHKTIETRLFDEKRSRLNVGDVIEFSMNENIDSKITARVKGLYRCESFTELFSAFSPDKFGGSSKEDLLENIYNFYSVDDEKKFGVVGIIIEKI